MKIGIYTLPLHGNYGGNLQAYALMKVLRDMGHEPWLINRRGKQISKSRIAPELAKQLIKKFVLRRPGITIGAGIFNDKDRQRIERHARRFIATEIQPQTKPFKSARQLRSEIRHYNFDAIIVGSDQVWRPRYAPDIKESFLAFLRPADGIRRISYAPSFGTHEWEYSAKQQATCSELLKSFDAVSVREASAVDLCRDRLGVAASHVIDPTMLLGAEDYGNLLSKHPLTGRASRQRLLVYVLDEDPSKRQAIDFISDALNLEITRANAIASDGTAAPVEEWLTGFRDSEFVVTDSFHACVFAILFRKPFIAYGNARRGLARFESLLAMFSLGDRLVSSPEQVTYQLVKSDINWSHVNSVLEELRFRARAFLTSALSTGQGAMNPNLQAHDQTPKSDTAS